MVLEVCGRVNPNFGPGAKQVQPTKHYFLFCLFATLLTEAENDPHTVQWSKQEVLSGIINQIVKG